MGNHVGGVGVCGRKEKRTPSWYPAEFLDLQRNQFSGTSIGVRKQGGHPRIERLRAKHMALGMSSRKAFIEP